MSTQSIYIRDQNTYFQKATNKFLELGDEWMYKQRFALGKYPDELEFMYYEHLFEILTSCSSELDDAIEDKLEFKQNKCCFTESKPCVKCKPCEPTPTPPPNPCAAKCK